MLTLRLSAKGNSLNVLCIGAHCDDIEIGCSGALLALQARRSRLKIHWLVCSGNKDRHAETATAMRSLVRPSNRGEMFLATFPDTCFPAAYSELKAFIAQVRERISPDVIFCHERTDAHQDHRTVNELVWGAFRDHLILEYEVPKWDGGLGSPNTYIALPTRLARRKVQVLMKSFGSQRSRDWFRPETFEALMLLRGVECRATSGYAEAFHVRKLALDAMGKAML